MELALIALCLLAVPFVLPVVAWVYAARTRARLEVMEERVRAQTAELARLDAALKQLQKGASDAPAAVEPFVPPVTVARPMPPPATAVRPVTPPAPAAPAVPSLAPPPRPSPQAAPVAAALSAAKAAAAASSAGAGHQSLPPRPPRPPLPPPPPKPPAPAFDWESLVGVKLFSGIAGVALVFAAVFFLKYSVDHGWLQPPVRVLIGIAVAVGLLVLCELKAARRYPVTANAMDAAAVAVLFATFFAAHALWDLIPSLLTFVLLGIVTALAAVLSIRRKSLFIAVLGLLGGFATPVLLSTGQNQPIPLFAYLMLLNVGLAWVAYRQTWPLLTALTLALTTVYQWGWVWQYLSANQLTLAMGIFLVFPLASFAGLVVARRRPATGDGAQADEMFERTAIVAAAMPLLFAVYLSTVPAYGERPWLLFGFLLLIDAGLLAIAIARGQGILHAAGAAATLLVAGAWVALSYTPAGMVPALVFCAIFVMFYALAPAVAARLGGVLEGAGADAVLAAPLLLAVLAALARIEPALASPLLLFGTLLPLILLIAWRAIVSDRGSLYFIGAFFAIATQAAWSATHLAVDRLGTAVAIYTVFGLVSLAVPLVARRIGRPLQPESGGGLVLIASLGLLLFLSLGDVAPAALWALALLLAIINAGLFIESAAGGLPAVSMAGSLLSWVVLAAWWSRAAAVVGILPSLTVLAGLSLLTLGGFAWAHHREQRARLGSAGANFLDGLALGLVGHLFLLFVALNPEWSLPPWPWLATLAVLTLGASAVSLFTRAAALHAATVIVGAIVIATWTAATGAPWMIVALAAGSIASAFALAWIPIARRVMHDEAAAGAAAGVLFVGEATAILAAYGGGVPFPAIVASHVVNLSIVLALTWTYHWPRVALWAVAPASVAAAVQGLQGNLAESWMQLLVLACAMYAVFAIYPLALGRRAREERDPYLAAVLASVMFFVAGREALQAGGYEWMIGALPVVEGAVLAVLLRQVLSLQPAGQRDLGRLALIGGATLAFATVAIPLQLSHQWITIGWAIEGAALAWLYGRVPHRGLLYWSVGLMGAVFVRLALNEEVFYYEPRGAMRIFNWYLYAYLTCAAALLLAAWWFSRTDDNLGALRLRASQILPAGAVILLFLLLNIEIADFYAVGPSIMFRFGAGVSQDLTYTIGWLVFGMLLLAACIYMHNRVGRVTALTLIALTTFKCFLYDLSSLEGLYRVGSFVGLAMSLALVSLALQKFVLIRPAERAS